MSVINVRLPLLRVERGLSQRQLAELTNLRPDTISALERGASRGLQFDTLARLCDALRCEPGDLFDLDREVHVVPVLGGPDEDEIIRARLAERERCAAGGPADAPSAMAGEVAGVGEPVRRDDPTEAMANGDQPPAISGRTVPHS